MKLKTLEIHNLGVHKHLKVQFGDGLTGIFGPQGSGKSTIIAGVYAAITNDFSRIADVKQGAICQQSEGKHSGVEVLLEANNDQIILSRMLAPNASNRLRTRSGLNITNDNKIREEITRLLGASRGLLDNYVFVDQWEIRSLFKATATQRAEAMSLLCGTKFIDTCYAVVTKMREADLSLLNQGLEDIDRLKQELADYQRLLAAESKILKELEAKLLPVEELEELNKLVLNYSLASKLEEERLELKGKLEEVAIENLKHDETVNSLEENLTELIVLEEFARKSLEDFKLQQGLYESQLERWNRKCKLEDDLARLISEIKPFDGPNLEEMPGPTAWDKQIAALDEAMAPLLSIINQFEKLPDLATCPTCGQSLEDFKLQFDSAKEKIKPLAEERNVCIKAKAERVRLEREYADYLFMQEMAQNGISKLKSAIAELNDAVKPEEPSINLEVMQIECNKASNNVSLGRKFLQEVVHNRAVSLQKCENLKQRMAEVESHLQKMAIKTFDYSEATAKLQEDQVNRQSLAASQAKCTEYKRVVGARETAISDAEKSRAEALRVREWVDLLARTLPILHRDGLPKAVHSRAMRQVEGEINEKLEEFECPFRVKTGDDLSYIAKFCNGTEVPAHRLSGGQQVVLSLAMRWALNSLFASQIGLLTLDEPTAGLDDRHLGLLQSTLSKLGAAARNRGCQVVIITHEKRLRSVFDQVIELERPVL